MEAISYTKARNTLSGVMEQVCQDHVPVVITRQKQSSVVIISLEDYNSINETLYLMKSPKNAERLNQAVDDLANNKNFKKMDI